MLTDQQQLQFETFGFLVLRRLFKPHECEVIDREFTEALETAYRHAPFDGTKRHWVPMLGPSTPFFSSLLEDPRLCQVAEQLYGDDTLGSITDANRYVGNTTWHPDTQSFHHFGVKFAFYLDPVGPDSGALRVIPGSHRQPYHDEVQRTIGRATDELELQIQDVPAYVCTSEPGDVVAFDLRMLHASYGGSDDRRMCTCVYYNNPKTPQQEQATRDMAERNRNVADSFNRPGEPRFDPYWLKNVDASPKRQRWIDRMRQLGFFE